MINFLKALFRLPTLQDDLQTYIARILRTVLVATALLAVLYTALNIISDPGNLARYGVQFLFIVSSLAVMLYLLHKQHPRTASILLVLSSWLVFSTAAYTGGGIISSAYMGYLVVLTMAGLLAADTRWTIATALLCGFSGAALLLAELNGILPATAVKIDSASFLIDSLIYFALVAALQILATRIVIDALKRARQESTEKHEAEAREKRLSALLRKVISLGQEVTQTSDLDWCLKKIHESIQKSLGFDRVGLFLYDENQKLIQGAYGTDREGNLEDTRWFAQNAEEYDAWQVALRDPEGINIVSNYSEHYASLGPESEMYGVREHLTLAAWAGKKPVALITVDNAITNRPFKEEEIEALRLFAGYAGLAIANAQTLQAVNQELESFSYSVSHDLRSPLRAVVGFSQILLNENELTDEASRQQYLQKINENGRVMGLLIDDLLSFSRVGRQQLRMSTCETQIMVEGIIERLREKHKHKKEINWIIHELPACKADYSMLQLVWLNLLENACKYSLSNPQPQIEIGSTQQDNELIYYVSDNGEGFEMKYAEKIFNIFQRLNNEDTESTGIGLSIVQRIVQRHGGRVWAKSEYRKGATFYFTLP